MVSGAADVMQGSCGIMSGPQLIARGELPDHAESHAAMLRRAVMALAGPPLLAAG